MLHILAPELTRAPEKATDFTERLLNALPTEVSVRLDHVPQVRDCTPESQDAVVLYCSSDSEPLEHAVEQFLERSRDSGAYIAPVALDSSSRHPPRILREYHAFDVADCIQRRELHPQQFAATAEDFAFGLLAATRPTCAAKDLSIFISYKRGDAEDEARILEGRLRARGFTIHRDLVEIQAGEIVEQAIRECLLRADALLLIDTPAAAESDWIRWEVELALRHAVPITWITCGEVVGRRPLPLKPSDRPDLHIADLTDSSAADLVCEAIQSRTRLHIQETQYLLRYAKARLAESGASLKPRDERRQIFEVQLPAVRRGNYPVRGAADLVQFFGRRPRPEDVDALHQYIVSEDLGPHQLACRAFDAAIILSPLYPAPLRFEPFAVVEDGYQYLRNLAEVPRRDKASPIPATPRLLLVGAFPERDEAQLQTGVAVRQVSEQWLENGGSLVYGGHPTFSAIIEGVVGRVAARNKHPEVEVYLSRWFERDESASVPSESIKTTWIDAEESRDGSLARMRQSLVVDSGAAAAVAIGGKTHEGDQHRPGVPEEIELARQHGIPCFLLGKTGGATAQLVGERLRDPDLWLDLGNGLDADANWDLASTDDYRAACQVVWETATQ